jgi:hypothetical protein
MLTAVYCSTPLDQRDSMLYLGYVLDTQQLEEINDKIGGVIKPVSSPHFRPTGD